MQEQRKLFSDTLIELMELIYTNRENVEPFTFTEVDCQNEYFAEVLLKHVSFQLCSHCAYENFEDICDDFKDYKKVLNPVFKNDVEFMDKVINSVEDVLSQLLIFREKNPNCINNIADEFDETDENLN